MRKLICLFLFCQGIAGIVFSQRDLGVRPTESGGVLSPEQASYDVLSYDLAVRVDPERRAIRGSLTIEARVVQPMARLALDLDSPLEVHAAVWLAENETPLLFERSDTQLWIDFPTTRQPGETVRVRIDYGGKPREARRPPWVGGFVWAQTADGRPWIAVACQVDGADLWWPTKDHPSDEPERVDIRITVPRPLEAVSNGTLQSVREGADGWRTFHWRVVNPINAYNVTLNIAPYRKIEGRYKSVSGLEFPIAFWVLPENLEKGRALFKQIREHLRFFEKTLGPYPFRNEKYGVAETPYLGMEHQTITAYGNNYRNGDYGFDVLHLHELAHEWWGNLVSVVDWRDYWIHEGFASYMEALYAESLKGRSALADYMRSLRKRIRNQDPVAPRESRTTVAKYFVPPDYTRSDGDVNFKGALVLHSLRYLIGDEAFFKALRRFAYPDASWERRIDGSQCRFAATEDFQHLVETIAGQDLSWFFEVYLRQPRLPKLTATRADDRLTLGWAAPDGLPFPMPIDVLVNGRPQRIEMLDGSAVLSLKEAEEIQIDPEDWVLRDN